MSTFIWT